MQSFDTSVLVFADAGSNGQAVDFDGPYVSGLVITNNSGVSIQYSSDAATWSTVGNGQTVSPGVTDSSAFYLRKMSSGGPVAVRMAWRSGFLDPTSVAITGGSISAGVVGAANTFVLFGDSITANNDVVTAAQRWAQSFGYFTAANVLLNQRAVVVNYAGVSGNTTTQMLARISTDVLAYQPKYCVVLAGINDIASGATAAQIIANLQSIYSQLLSAGITVVACTVMPSSLRITTTALHTLLHTVNQAIKDYVIAHRGMVLADFHAAFVDATTGAHLAAFSGDSLHPNTVGAWNLGRCLYEVLDPLLPKTLFLASSPTDRKNLIYNPLGVGNNATGVGGFTNGAGITGNGPNGWTSVRAGAGTGVGSKVARADYWPGEFARLAMSATSTGDGCGWTFALRSSVGWFSVAAYALGFAVDPGTGFIYRCTTAGTSGGSQPTWPTTVGQQVADGSVTWTCYDKPIAGDVMEAWIEFQTSSFSGAGIPYAYVQVLDGGSPVFSSGSNFYNGDGLPSYLPAVGTLYIPRFTIPSTAGSMAVNLQIRAIGSAGVSGNLDIGRVYARITNR